MLLPVLLAAEAEKPTKLPVWTDVAPPGERITRATNGDWPAGRWPPQPIAHREMIASTEPEQNLRMQLLIDSGFSFQFQS
jgi:hypothetical protein